MAMIILCIISGLLSFTRDFLTKDDIIQADYLQEKEDGKDTNSSGFFYEDRNSSAASIEIDHSLQGPPNPNDSGAILY